MRIAVCEDEKNIAQKLLSCVEDFMSTTETYFSVDVFLCGLDFLNADGVYDLLFLDFELPDMSGMDIAKKLREDKKETTIIFVTAYADYVYESFEVDAFRYILKPVEEEKISKALKSFLSSRRSENHQINIPTARKDNIVNLSEIVYIEADGKYSIVRSISNGYFKSTKPISYYQKLISELSDSFFQTHRRFIVNMRYISKINEKVIVFVNGENAEISRRNVSDFNKKYTEFLKNRSK